MEKYGDNNRVTIKQKQINHQGAPIDDSGTDGNGRVLLRCSLLCSNISIR